MSARTWVQRFSRSRRRRKAAAENRREPLREFVYLDEVSVFSLLASRIGALATDFTDSESSSLTTEVKGDAGVSTPIAKATLSSAVKADQARGTQVMRKSTVQSTFRELYGYVRDSLVIGPPGTDAKRLAVPRVDDLLVEAGGTSPWVIDVAELKRGQLLEVEVELEADVSFRASTIMSTMMEFIEEMPRLPDSVDLEGMINAMTGTRLLDKLLAGLVPMRGRIADYRCAEIGERELLVHSELLDRYPELADNSRAVQVVGVGEASLFWRDIRRVLFSNGQYRMLCRLEKDGLHADWTPVKLMDLLEGVVPSLGELIDQMPSLLASMGASEQTEDEARRMGRALQRYALELAAIYAVPLTAEDLAARGLPTAEQSASYGTLEARRAAFGSLTAALTDEFGFTTSPEVLAACRTEALMDVQLLAPGLVTPGGEENGDPDSLEPVSYLDCEIVAIYW
jgi:hypothetical protein